MAENSPLLSKNGVFDKRRCYIVDDAVHSVNPVRSLTSDGWDVSCPFLSSSLSVAAAGSSLGITSCQQQQQLGTLAHNKRNT